MNKAMKQLIEETKGGWVSSRVKCDLCTHEWIAVFYKDTERLECPYCHNMVDYEMIEFKEQP